MVRHTVWRWMAAVIFSGASVVATAAEDLLRALPQHTLGVVVVNRLAGVDAKIVGWGQALQLPVPGLLGLLKAQAGVTTGLDEQRAAMLVVVGGEELDDEPVALLYLPIADYPQFIGQLKPKDAGDGLSKVELWKAPFVVRQVQRYAVFAEPRHKELLAEAATKTAAPAELTPVLSYLLANDLSAAITRRGIQVLNMHIQEQIKQLQETFANAPDNLQFAGKAFAAYRSLFAAAERELATVAAGVVIEKTGTLRASGRVRVKPESKFTARLAALHPRPENSIAGLPAQPFVFAVGGGAIDVNWKELLADLGSFTEAGFSMYGLSPADGKKMVELSRQSLQGFQSMSFSMLVLGTDPPLYRDLVGIVHVTDAQEYLDNYRRAIANINQLFGKAQGGALKMRPTEVEALKVEGLPALKLTASVPQMLGMPGGAEQLQEALLGAGGRMVFHVVALDKQRVVFTYQTKPELLNEIVTALQRRKPCLAADPLVAKTTALLPNPALGVGYLSPQGAIGIANRFLTVMPSMGSGPLLAFPAVPPIGAAVTTAAGEVQGEVVVPIEVSQGIKNYAFQMLAAHAAGQMKNQKKEARPPAPADKK